MNQEIKIDENAEVLAASNIQNQQKVFEHLMK